MRLNRIPAKRLAHAQRERKTDPAEIIVSLCDIYGHTCKGTQTSSLASVI